MKKHILIVDDEADIRELLAEYLSQFGFRITAVGSPDEAERVVEKDLPNLIISDLQLEDSDGLSMVRAIKNKRPDMPVLLLTGIHFDPEVVRTKLSKTVTSYLQKTVALERIVAEVRHLLNEGPAAPEGKKQ
ncbi:MAG TPA: response regulator [Opitutaceae bacterium]|nr:response regulator [Opitutaceae bacterium]HND62371.1 response regulator [Opitutaceae bacterium]